MSSESNFEFPRLNTEGSVQEFFTGNCSSVGGNSYTTQHSVVHSSSPGKKNKNVFGRFFDRIFSKLSLNDKIVTEKKEMTNQPEYLYKDDEVSSFNKYKRTKMINAIAPNMSAHTTVLSSMSSNTTALVSKNNRRVAVFSAGKYVKEFIKPIESICKPVYVDSCLDETTAQLAENCHAVNVFVNDDLSAPVLDVLKKCGVTTITLRCAGFDRLDIEYAKELGFTVYRVPAYSPRSVAELALTHMMTLSRNVQTILPRIKTGNYTVEGLVGREITGKTIGIVGTGKIAQEFIKLVKPMAGRIVAFDVYENDYVKSLGVEYKPLAEVVKEADVLSLHCPLMESTYHMINKETLSTMKNNAVIINTARGGLIDTEALIEALENGTIAGAAMDVYEHESGLFFTDRAVLAIGDRMKQWDKKFARLAHLPNAIVSPHVAFLTEEALQNIADTTTENLLASFAGERNGNMVF